MNVSNNQHIMKKERHNPDKPQNKYGGDYNCLQYEKRCDGSEWCHDEGNSSWGQFIKWDKKDNDGKLSCNGNRHNCYKLQLKWWASLSQIEKDKYSRLKHLKRFQLHTNSLIEFQILI